MGQGADEPDQTETIEQQNSRLSSTMTDEKAGFGDDEKERGSGFSKRTRSSTLAGEGDSKQHGRNRSSTLAGGESHDHDEAFPKEERDQMEELLHEVTGQLGEFFKTFFVSESP